jgi:hypothetical protein
MPLTAQEAIQRLTDRPAFGLSAAMLLVLARR